MALLFDCARAITTVSSVYFQRVSSTSLRCVLRGHVQSSRLLLLQLVIIPSCACARRPRIIEFHENETYNVAQLFFKYIRVVRKRLEDFSYRIFFFFFYG